LQQRVPCVAFEHVVCKERGAPVTTLDVMLQRELYVGSGSISI
jgi:hypothetical protein